MPYAEPLLGQKGIMENSKISRISPILRRAILQCFATSFIDEDLSMTPEGFFLSPAIHAVKEEIVRTGKKLWDRQYVDGNGGNISARISPRWVVCTPTLCSKSDLSTEDMSLVDLQNSHVCGERPCTSEILLHLEIYKAVPQAKGVIHCHPPYATAHAVAGVVPQGNLLPEQEVFIGPVALTPYETPGTFEFARTVVPVVRRHNTILLENHGVVSWADSVTHAEWLIEVIETYCKTLMIARQLRSPLKEIPAEKIPDLLAIKRRLGLPDARYADQDESEWEDKRRGDQDSRKSALNEDDIDRFVDSLSAQVLEFFKEGHA